MVADYANNIVEYISHSVTVEAELINFELDGENYTAEKGSTWSLWKSSKYCPLNISNSITVSGSTITLDGYNINTYTGSLISAIDTIINGQKYYAKTINFYINNQKVTAGKGMNWLEWGKSGLRPEEIGYAMNSNLFEENIAITLYTKNLHTSTGIQVYYYDEIIANHYYSNS